MINTARFLATGMALAMLAACTPDSPVSVSNGWVRLPPPTAESAAAYFSIKNHGARDLVIDAVSSPAFGHAMLHRSAMADGVMTMRSVAEIRVPPGGEVALQPGGLHVMLMQPAAPLAAGDRVTLTLSGDGEPLIELTLTVAREAP